jgi:hypothetical protein
MITRRRVLALGSSAVLVFSAAALFAQNNQEPRKLTNAEKKEIQTVLKIVDDVVGGQPAPNELGLAWVRQDLLKAQGNKQYMPFTISIDPAKLTSDHLSLYWRVVSTDVAAPAADAADDDKKKDDKDDKPQYAYEDLNLIEVPSGQAAPLRVSRSFTVAPGNYDVYVVAKEPTPEKKPKNAAPPKVSLIKQAVKVDDLWNGQLNTSSVIVAERIDPLPAPLDPTEQAQRPYALGTMEITPAFDNHFTKKSELSTFLLIYNAKTDSANKPDVTVEYNFYTKQDGVEKFFNKTNPQNLNAQTLPPQFDFAAGHQLQSGQAVPLASFPEGDYRLEIKVTDKIASASLTRNVEFTIAGS